jgi:hypothetical protein
MALSRWFAKPSDLVGPWIVGEQAVRVRDKESHPTTLPNQVTAGRERGGAGLSNSCNILASAAHCLRVWPCRAEQWESDWRKDVSIDLLGGPTQSGTRGEGPTKIHACVTCSYHKSDAINGLRHNYSCLRVALYQSFCLTKVNCWLVMFLLI